MIFEDRSNPKTMRTLPFFSLAILVAAGTPASGAPALLPSQQACLQKAERHEKQGWIYLHIEGAPRERGFQHGYLLAPEIAESVRVIRALWEYGSAMEWPWLVEKTSAFLEPNIDAENLAEIDGIAAGLRAAGVSISRAELIAYNGWFELDWYWWP